MSNKDLFELFVDELADVLSAEHQIIGFLPKLIKLASFQELKETLTKQLSEVEIHRARVEQIFSIINVQVREKTCKGIGGIIKEGQELVESKVKSAVLDAAIISAAQKVEHYKIATYGTLRSFAQYLKLNSEVSELIQQILNETVNRDKKLTKVAEGSLFSTGVNKEAAEAGVAGVRSKN